jgi:hypothetical protein
MVLWLHGWSSAVTLSSATTISCRFWGIAMSVESHPQAPLINRSKERWIWLLIPAACLIPALLSGLQPYVLARLDGRSPKWQDIPFPGSEWIFLGALTPITYYFAKRFPLERAKWRSMLGAHLIGALGLCIGWASLGMPLALLLHRVSSGPTR